MKARSFVTFVSFVSFVVFVFWLNPPSSFADAPSVINFGRRDLKKIALTFDADMTPSMEKLLHSRRVESLYNAKVIEILKREKVPATIFMTGLWAKNYPGAVSELSANPLFEIGNHSYAHLAFARPCFNLPLVPNKERDLSDSQEILKKTVGQVPVFFRFPGGCFKKTDLELLGHLQIKNVIGWDVTSGDAFGRSTSKIIKKVEKQVRSGSIVVFHLHGNRFAPRTAAALPTIIAFLKNKGYQLVKVSQMIKDLQD